MSCTTCQPNPYPCYSETLDRYSLQDDLYLYVVECLPGYNCGGGFFPGRNPWSYYFGKSWLTYVTLVCCDGDEENIPLTSTMSQAQIDHLIGAAIEACLRRTAFCSPACNTPGCSPSEPPPSAPPDTEDPPTIYVSPPWTVRSACSNGSIFTFTLPGGRYLGFNEAAVLSATRAEAQRLATSLRICLGDFVTNCCAETVFDETIRVTGSSTAHSWSVIAGALPPGLALPSGWVSGNVVHITGTPTTGGVYTFTIRATNTSGNYTQRSYAICVIQISPVAAALPDAPLGDPYSQALTASSCAIPALSWQVTGGALPPGITLNESTGVLSGTPTAAGSYAFTITLQTEAT